MLNSKSIVATFNSYKYIYIYIHLVILLAYQGVCEKWWTIVSSLATFGNNVEKCGNISKYGFMLKIPSENGV